MSPPDYYVKVSRDKQQFYFDSCMFGAVVETLPSVEEVKGLIARYE